MTYLIDNQYIMLNITLSKNNAYQLFSEKGRHNLHKKQKTA